MRAEKRSQAGPGRNAERRTGRLGTGRSAAVGLLLAAAVGLAGCGAGDERSSETSLPGYAYNEGNATEWQYGGGQYETAGFDGAGALGDAQGGAGLTKPADGSGAGIEQYRGQKLIRRVNLSVETKEFDALMPALNAQVRQLGGYIESMESYNGSRYADREGARHARMTVRIPREQLDGFLETVSGVCNIVRHNESSEDVTLTYVDTESRRNTLRAEQERLLAFLEKAQSIEEIIIIEDRLSDVRYQLENMEARLRTIDNQVDYSTVDMEIDEVKELTPVEEPGAWDRISAGFGQTLQNIGDGAVDFGVWLAVNLPYLVIWAAVITAAALAIRRLGRKSRKKREAREREQSEGGEPSRQSGDK